jgi:signal transduction histidine kinase
MKRPWQIAVVFGLCLAVVLAAMAWTSRQVLRLDRAQAEAAAQAVHEENIRSALYHMELAVLPLLAQEASHRYFEYASFYAPDRAYTQMLANVRAGEVLVRSPILVQGSPVVLLNFQIDPNGTLTSPQVPVGRLRDLAVPGLTSREAIEAAAARLAELEPQISRTQLTENLPRPEDRPAPTAVAVWNQRQVPLVGPNSVVSNSVANMSQAERSQIDFQNRNRAAQMAANTAGMPEQQLMPLVNINRELGDVQEGAVQAVWLGDKLLMARRVLVSGREYLQGAWLDWPALRERLLAEVVELLPQADLVPERGPVTPETQGRMLAALPVRLVPGPMDAPAAEGLSPLVLSLLAAWVGAGLAAAAVAVLLWKAVALSERRAAFVSAVTHELRTPLTTFRMYSEMLAGDMVPDEAKRRRYLGTLRVEADRLTHLVENVLSYARIERKPMRSRLEPIAVTDLVGRSRQRLADRAAQAGMELVVEIPEAVGAASVRADPSAVEQILFNLVDNACKYAARAADRRIHLAADVGGRDVRLMVCDHGPGIETNEGRRLFRPFTKSARDAANSALGVGLGLALSRRLAREMGGNLTLDPGPRDGACFILCLPSA